MSRSTAPCAATLLAAALALLLVQAGPLSAQIQPSGIQAGPRPAWIPEGWIPDAILDPGREAGIIFVVDKARQELQIWHHDGRGKFSLEKVIPCSTGIVRGDKLLRGDMKTPDGFYVFNKKLLPEELPDLYGILAYPMDYPNLWDRILDHGGGGIWTHGVNKPLVDYDSNGCVELLNHDLAGLEDRILLFDTPILLYEDMAYAPPERLLGEGARVAAFVEYWRTAWAGKDLKGYAALYDEGFRSSDGMGRSAWLSHKRNVAAGYRNIRVDVSGLKVFRHRDVTVASFEQRYDGDGRYSSVGTKRLYLKAAGNGYLIVAEDFEGNRPNPPDKRLDPELKREALTRPPLAVASFSSPVAAAGAGAILPGMPVPAIAVSLTIPDDTQDELERSALEARASGTPRTGATLPAGAEDGPEPQPSAAPQGPQVPQGSDAPILTASLGRPGASGREPFTASDASGPPSDADLRASLGSPSDAPSIPSPSASRQPSGPRMSSQSLEPASRNPTVTVSLTGTPAGASRTGRSVEGAPEVTATLVADASGAAPSGTAASGTPGTTGASARTTSSAAASAGGSVDIDVPDTGTVGPNGVAGPPQSGSTLASALAAVSVAATPAEAQPVTPAEALPATPAAALSASSAAALPTAVPTPDDDRAAINSLLSSWAGYWEEKELEGYFSCYADDFRFLDKDMDLKAFVKYRTGTIGRAGTIDVELEGPRIRLDGDRATVTFVQRYSSDSYSDSGEKTLRLARRDGAWKIVSETFRARG
jgi:murein L,D-transpeptidase YafK